MDKLPFSHMLGEEEDNEEKGEERGKGAGEGRRPMQGEMGKYCEDRLATADLDQVPNLLLYFPICRFHHLYK